MTPSLGAEPAAVSHAGSAVLASVLLPQPCVSKPEGKTAVITATDGLASYVFQYA
jgi:hypothetical protein